MNLIAIFSVCGLGVILTLGCVLWGKREQLLRLNRDVTRIITFLFLVMAYVFLSNALEWVGLSNALDPYEDYAEVVWPLLWGAALYVWIQTGMVNALLRSTTALEHVQHLTAGIMDTSPTGIIVVGSDGNINFANAYAGNIIGISKEKLLQHSYDELAQLLIGYHITPISREELPFHQVMIKKSAIHSVRLAINSRGGDIRELSVNAAPLMDENGDIERVVIVLNDVTDLVKAEYQVTHLNAVLRATRAMGQLVARERNPDLLLEQVCRVLVEARGYKYAWIVRSEPRGQIIAAAESGREISLDAMQTALLNHKLPCLADTEVMETGTCSARIIDCSECAFQYAYMPGITQAISVCLEYNKINYGILVVGVTAGFEVDADESLLLQEAATDLAFALYGIAQEHARQQVEANLALKVDAEANFQERLRVLVEINNELALSGSADELCLRAVEMGTRRLKFDRMGIWLRGELNPQILVGSYGIDEVGNVRDERHIRRKVQDEFERFADANGAVVTSYVNVELHNQLGDVVGKGMQMSAGIWDGHRFIGLLDIDNLFGQRRLDTYDGEILGLFAATLGHLYSRIRAEERLQNALALHQQRAAQQEALNAIIANAATATELEALVVLVLRRTLSALNLDSGFVWALDVQSSTGTCQGVVQHLLQQVVDSGVDADAILTVADVKAINVVLSVEMYPGWFADVTAALQAHSVHSFLAVPVMRGTERIGGLVFTSDHPVAWTREERGLVAAVAQQLGSTSERIKLMAEVQNQVSNLQTVMDAVPEGVILLEQYGKVLLSNARGLEDLLFLSDVSVGEKLLGLGNYPLADFLIDRPRVKTHEVHKGERTFEVIAKPAGGAAGARGWVLVLRDVTEERAITVHHERQERLAALGRMAAGIAHDFNNIMAVVVLYTQMAARQKELTPATRERLKVVTEQIRRATELIQQILDFSRRSTLDTKPVNLTPFLDETCSIIRRTLPKGINLRVRCDDGLHVIDADVTRLQQVLMNLTNNACEAMTQGGSIEIIVDNIVVTEIGMPDMPTLEPGNWVRLRFSDSGKGMPENIQPYIFEPFYSTKILSGGTGLGLAQVHGIVKQHNGEITVDSELDHGTTFTLYFPAAQEAAVLIPESISESTLLTGNGEMIMIVEDNADTRDALTQALQSLAYTVVQAENGLQAMVRLESTPLIKAILSDAIMPELGGVGLLRAMQARGYDVPVVILSGYLAPEIRAELSAPNNLVAWLSKPVDYYTLAETLAKAVKTAVS